MIARIIALSVCCVLAVSAAGLAQGTGVPPAGAPPADLSPAAREVWATEMAFAKTMADRDHTAFVSFLAEETVFFGQKTTLRGKAAVADVWHRYYEGAAAPFSWGPDRVAVLDSGTLAFSSGPVFDPQGNRSGTFNSVWRRDADGTWRIVFDKGCPPCECR
jgi:ketosteroid isomerase-like protein